MGVAQTIFAYVDSFPGKEISEKVESFASQASQSIVSKVEAYCYTSNDRHSNDKAETIDKVRKFSERFFKALPLLTLAYFSPVLSGVVGLSLGALSFFQVTTSYVSPQTRIGSIKVLSQVCDSANIYFLVSNSVNLIQAIYHRSLLGFVSNGFALYSGLWVTQNIHKALEVWSQNKRPLDEQVGAFQNSIEYYMPSLQSTGTKNHNERSTIIDDSFNIGEIDDQFHPYLCEVIRNGCRQVISFTQRYITPQSIEAVNTKADSLSRKILGFPFLLTQHVEQARLRDDLSDMEAEAYKKELLNRLSVEACQRVYCKMIIGACNLRTYLDG